MNAIDRAQDLDAEADHPVEQYQFGVGRLGPTHALVLDLDAKIRQTQEASASTRRHVDARDAACIHHPPTFRPKRRTTSTGPPESNATSPRRSA